MRRACLERRRTFREWRSRHELDVGLVPGYFRKGRRARGCPRVCSHCRAQKLQPKRRQIAADLAWSEWLDACHDTSTRNR